LAVAENDEKTLTMDISYHFMGTQKNIAIANKKKQK